MYECQEFSDAARFSLWGIDPMTKGESETKQRMFFIKRKERITSPAEARLVRSEGSTAANTILLVGSRATDKQSNSAD